MKPILTVLPLLLLSLRQLPADERPNIVFLFADDQTTDTLGCYGNATIETPNIDSLAARGMRFENAFVSQSICWVSRTTILTGLIGRSCCNVSPSNTGTNPSPSGLAPTAADARKIAPRSGFGYRGRLSVRRRREQLKLQRYALRRTRTADSVTYW